MADATITKMYVGLNDLTDDNGRKVKNFFVIKGTNFLRRRTIVEVKRSDGVVLFSGRVWEVLDADSKFALVKVTSHGPTITAAPAPAAAVASAAAPAAAAVFVPTVGTDTLTISVENPQQVTASKINEDVNIYED